MSMQTLVQQVLYEAASLPKAAGNVAASALGESVRELIAREAPSPNIPIVIFPGICTNHWYYWPTCRRLRRKLAAYDPVEIIKPHRGILHAQQIEAYREGVANLLRPGCYLVGYSMGGYIALSFLASHPSMVAKVFLIDCPTNR